MAQPLANAFSHTGSAIRLVNSRLDLERKKQLEFRNERSETGRIGAKARWGKRLSDNGSAIAQRMAEPMANHGSSSSSISTVQKTERDARAREVEFPPGFPETGEDALVVCMNAGVPEEFVRSTWNKAAGRGGKDAKGQPVVRFANHVKAEWGYNQNRAVETLRRNGKPERVMPVGDGPF